MSDVVSRVKSYATMKGKPFVPLHVDTIKELTDEIERLRSESASMLIVVYTCAVIAEQEFTGKGWDPAYREAARVIARSIRAHGLARVAANSGNVCSACAADNAIVCGCAKS